MKTLVERFKKKLKKGVGFKRRFRPRPQTGRGNLRDAYGNLKPIHWWNFGRKKALKALLKHGEHDGD